MRLLVVLASTGALAGLAAVAANAQAPNSSANIHVFTCRDSSGKVITSDHPPEECARTAIQERTQGGVLVREIPAPLTPEQQRQKAIDDKRRHDQELAAQEQRRKDRALLAAYSTEDELQAARARSLAEYEDAIKLNNQNLQALLQERDLNNKDAAAYRGKALPLDLQHRIDENEAAISGVTHSLADNRSAMDRINQRFDADLDRFRYLEKQQAEGK